MRQLTEKDLAWADCAFIGAMIVQREAARRMVARCKQAGLRVVAGGPLFTSEHEQFTSVDHFILNEAELTLPPFLEDLARGCARRVYTSSDYVDLHTTPAPQWDLLNLRRYASMSVQFSRGCPFNCDFCNVTALFGHRVRMKTSAQVIAELDALYALGWRGEVFFVDDNFIGNKAFLKADLLPALTAWREGKTGNVFYTEASINLADDPELMAMMREAGFSKVFIGIETPDEDSLAECSKLQNRNRNLVDDVKRIQREGRLRGEGSGDNVDGTTNIVPAMSLIALRDGYKRILTHIYSPEPYYRRIRTFLREYRPPRRRGHFRFSHALACVRSFYRIGILSRERFHYWGLLLWTQFRCPRLLVDAITLAIQGYHFRKVTEMHVA